MKEIKVNKPVTHDGERYTPGDVISGLTKAQEKRLKRLGVIGEIAKVEKPRQGIRIARKVLRHAQDAKGGELKAESQDSSEQRAEGEEPEAVEVPAGIDPKLAGG